MATYFVSGSSPFPLLYDSLGDPLCESLTVSHLKFRLFCLCSLLEIPTSTQSKLLDHALSNPLAQKVPVASSSILFM
jgi:hypothetical protein